MESFQHTPILPSNAPPWPESNDSSTTRELQACNNLKIEVGQLGSTQDYLGDTSDDSTDAASCVRLGSMISYSQPSQMHSQTYDWIPPDRTDVMPFRKYSRHGGMSRAHIEEYQAEQKARLLAARFSRCEGYIKYRNRQPKEKKNKDDQKWPDHIEDAFLRALCRWEPCGRGKKVPPGGTKLMGRNELIADYILVHTGELRTRKQVSSHIQVLKPFVLNEPMIMQYLATPPTKPSQAAKSARKGRSTYNPEGRLKKDLADQCSDYTLQSLLDLQPEEFHMYMRRIDGKAERPEDQATADASKILHTYSSTSNSQPSQRHIQNQVEMYEHFPELTTLPIDRYKYGKFLALQVPITLHEQRQLGKTELAISFVFKAPSSNPAVTISSRTSLYQNGIPFSYNATGANATTPIMNFGKGIDSTIPYDECKGEGIEFEQDTTSSTSQFSPNTKSYKAKMIRYYVPFSSKFWADYLWRTALSHHSATDLESQADGKDARYAAAQAKHEEVTTALNGLTAVQEIVASRLGCDPQVVLTVHFRFSHAITASPNTTWQFLDFTSVFDDAVDRSNSSSQDNAHSVGIEHIGGSGDDTVSYDLDYTNSGCRNDGLASPVTLVSDTGAIYNTSWINNELLPVSTRGMDPPLHNAYPQIFEFVGTDNAMSLDSTEEVAVDTPVPYSLDVELAADPMVLPPQGTAGYDYAEFFEHPHGTPKHLGFQARRLEQMVSQVDIPFQMQAFAGADTSSVHRTDTESGSFVREEDVVAGMGVDEQSFEGQQFGFRHIQGSEDGAAYLHSQPHETFGFGRSQSHSQVQDTFALPLQRDAIFAHEHDFFAHPELQAQEPSTHDSFGPSQSSPQYHDGSGFEEARPPLSRNRSRLPIHRQQSYGEDEFEFGQDQQKSF